MDLTYTFTTGVHLNGRFSTSIKVCNCPSVADGYSFLGKTLKDEHVGASNINHVPFASGKISPLRTYQYRQPIPVFISLKR